MVVFLEELLLVAQKRSPKPPPKRRYLRRVKSIDFALRKDFFRNGLEEIGLLTEKVNREAP